MKISLIKNSFIVLCMGFHSSLALAEHDTEPDAWDTVSSVIDHLIYDLHPGIPYPYWWKLKDSNPYFSHGMDKLHESCPVSNCVDWDIADAVIFSSDSQYNALYNRIKSKNKICQKNILDTLATRFEISDIPKSCLDEVNKFHAVCQDVLGFINLVKDRFMDMVALAYGEEALSVTEAGTFCTKCISEPPAVRDILHLSEILNTMHTQTKCTPFEAGEERTVFSGTGRNYSYKVKRELDGSYTIPLKVNFLPAKDYDGPVAKNKIPEHYTEKVNHCLGQASQKMLGPNGEKLRIQIKTPKTDCEKLDAHNIQISSKNVRSVSDQYASNVSCSTVLHESLHLLGLVDEYESTEKGFHVHLKTGKSNFKTFHIENRKKHIIIPGIYSESMLLDDCRVIQTNSIMSDSKERWNNVFKYGENKSLLDPGHFNNILYGSCEVNTQFNKCSQLAFKDSYYYPGCLEQKKHCQAQNTLGRDKKRELRRVQRNLHRTRRLMQTEANNRQRLIEWESGAFRGDRTKASKEEILQILFGVKNKKLEKYQQQIKNMEEELENIKLWPDQ